MRPAECEALSVERDEVALYDVIMAVSRPFTTKADAVAGISAVREYAGMGLISDSCATLKVPSRLHDYPAGQPADPQKVSKIDFHGRARAVHRAVSGPRWAGSIHNLS